MRPRLVVLLSTQRPLNSDKLQLTSKQEHTISKEPFKIIIGTVESFSINLRYAPTIFKTPFRSGTDEAGAVVLRDQLPPPL
jgi:hypothetical protein